MDEVIPIKMRLSAHIKGGEAFITLDELLDKIPFSKLGARPLDIPYSLYELFYHIWFTQWDILKYCGNEKYKDPIWPQDYWPKEKAPKNVEDWEGLKLEYFKDRELLIDQIRNPNTNLLAAVKNNPEHIFFREVLLVIEHTAYHTGQMIVLCRQLGITIRK